MNYGCGCGAGTACLGCDGQPYSGKTVDRCGVCGGNGSSCQPQCVYQLRVEAVTSSGKNVLDGQYPSCFLNYAAQYGVNTSTKTIQNGNSTTIGPGTSLASSLLGRIANGYTFLGPTCSFYDPNTAMNAVNNGWAQICGTTVVRYAHCPVSLLWKKDAKIEDRLSVVRFPLTTGEAPDAVYEWRASDDTPLVVYDETGSGKIESATQIFGQHTFGKKWRDGYEALASLDKDGDKKLQGDELKNLSLWFDSNRDGVSQPGEVKRLADVNVTGIFVTPDTREEGSKFIYASRGYERTEGNETVTLPSVDWFGTEFKSSHDAFATLSKMVGRGEVREEPVATQRVPKPEEARTGREALLAAPRLSGLWLWSLTLNGAPEKGRNGDGVLLINDDDPEKVVGYSFIEFALEKNKDSIEKVIKNTSFTALKAVDPDGKVELAFAIPKEHGVVTETRASLEADGSLSGVSVVKGEDNDGSYEYRWRAIRVE